MDNKKAYEAAFRFRFEAPKPTRKPPSINTMERWMSDGWAKATDGCGTEPDGTCEHGHQSWLLFLGII